MMAILYCTAEIKATARTPRSESFVARHRAFFRWDPADGSLRIDFVSTRVAEVAVPSGQPERDFSNFPAYKLRIR